MMPTGAATAPEIAILGHPNEGKSSVLSTLAEDDSVRVSATPGETVICRTFPVVIDGREVLRFTDTPGFQNPSRVLAEMQKLAAVRSDSVSEFRRQFKDIAELHDDIELLLPVQRGAGIIYVVDGSRPVRNVDRAEMEILRLTGRPRMAVINCKDEDFSYLDDWKNEFRKNFNSNRVFNAHRATYAERILLLEALKAIDQDWQHLINEVIEAFKADWATRNSAAVNILLTLFADCLSHTVKAAGSDHGDQQTITDKLVADYCRNIGKKEQRAHEEIRALFKHNIFTYQLPPHSILSEDLFSERSWQLLGMTQRQIALAGAVGGALVGAKLDLVMGGTSMGLFAGLGGAAGALGANFGGKKLTTGHSILGLKLGGEQLKIGPATNINLLFVLINRALLFYQHTINWAHGRRDYETSIQPTEEKAGTAGFTSQWSASELRICKKYFSATTRGASSSLDESRGRLGEILAAELEKLSRQE